MKLELVAKTDVSHVELVKDEKHCLGITIKSATQEEAGPVIKKVKRQSPAGRSFAVSEGDIVLYLNGRSTTGKGIKDITRMLKDVGSLVNLQLQYTIQEIRISRFGVYRRQYMTTRLDKINGSFGFVLRKKVSTQHSLCVEYPVVSNLKGGSQIHKKGQLQEGDRLLRVDGICLSWLPLAEIASILHDRDEAEFTFEYNVRVVSFTESDNKLDLEIDVPISDLGLSICMDNEDSTTMYISSIRLGSIADRCGVFSEGDIIVSINGIETKFLTLSKADFLLRKSKSTRKISFITSRRKELNVASENENSSYVSTEDGADTTESSTSGVETTDWKHVNTPTSSNIAFSVQQKYHSPKFCHSEQMKALDKFQHMVPVMTSLKHNLSRLTREAFKGKQNTLNQNCTFCDKTRHSVKLCASCLARMNVKCAQSMDSLRSLIAQFVSFSTNTSDLSLQSEIIAEMERNSVNENQSIKLSIRNMVRALTETLPQFFHGMRELQESFAVLAEKIANTDTSCNTCNLEIKSVMVIVQKLLLLISLKDNSADIKQLIGLLVYHLLETKFTCDWESEYTYPESENESDISASDNHSLSSVFYGRDKECSLQDSSIGVENNSQAEPCEPPKYRGNILNIPQLNTRANLEYLKIAHIESLTTSQNSVSENKLCETNQGTSSLVEDIATCPEVNNLESCLTTVNSRDSASNNVKHSLSQSLVESGVKCSELNNLENPLTNLNLREPASNNDKKIPSFSPVENSAACLEVNNLQTSTTNSRDATNNDDEKIYKDKLKLPQRVWRSLDSILRPKRNAKIQTVIQNGCPPTSNQSTETESNGFNHEAPSTSTKLIQNNALPNENPAKKKRNTSDSNGNSTRSSLRRVLENGTSAGGKRVRTETMEVKMTNDEGGFGLGISLRFVDDSASAIPVIHAVKPKSPSHKIGILKVDDRIVAINHQSTLDLNAKEFHSLKKRAFSADAITLTVEFDVICEELKFGTFDISLNKTLKIGLLFEAMKRGSPMIVSGVVKGSAAHRCGQLFKGDKIVFFRCIRNEEFDPVSCNYDKEEDILVTVQREPSSQGIQDKPIDAPECYFNPCFSYEDFVPRNGTNFAVKKTAVRAVKSIDALVLDQEVTLFRDRISWDFGILVGENQDTGRAYVTDVRPDGPAHESGVIKKFDRIVEVNGVPVDKNVKNSVLTLLSQANHKVDLLIRRLYHEDSKRICTEAEERPWYQHP